MESEKSDGDCFFSKDECSFEAVIIQYGLRSGYIPFDMIFLIDYFAHSSCVRLQISKFNHGLQKIFFFGGNEYSAFPAIFCNKIVNLIR